MSESDRSLVFDDVLIDFAGRRLLRGGAEQPLEPKAFGVLALLARHPGHVLTRDEILDAVWGHAHVTPGVLNRIMTLLRQALGEEANAPRYLHTVHGVGYRFDLPASAVVPAQIPEVPAAEAGPVVSAPAAPLQSRAADVAPARRFPPVAVWLLPLLAVLAFAGWKLRPHPQPDASSRAMATQPLGVAVLPLAHLGGDEQQRLLSDGLSDNLITTLSQYQGLRVIGRSSSFLFRDSKEDGTAIGAKLGVSHLIEGSVQRVGDDVRIGVELVRTADGSTVWTQRFDRPYKDLFALQDEIALAVAGALQVRLLHRMPGAVETGRPASGNLEAYAAYLRGTDAMGGRDFARAIEQFALATRLDPEYAQAWSWLGFVRTQHTRGTLTGDAARAAYAQARAEIDTALRLQPGFGQAHAIHANWLSTADHDWNGALAEFRTALSLVSNTDPTHGAISRLLATLGKVNEAIAERRKYIDGDPLAAFARVYLAELLASIGRLDEAEANLRDAAALQPDLHDWHAGERSYLAILRGDAETALAEAKSDEAGSWHDRVVALALQIGADHAAADAALKRLIETDGEAKRGAYTIARVYALRGDADNAFEWLQRDRERGDSGVHDVLTDPILLRFRDDPRFADYCRKAGLPLPSDSEALGIDRIRVTTGARH